jgi:hypothetical protein
VKLYNKWRAAAAAANQGEYSCCSFGGGVMREPNEQCHYYERDYHSWRGAGGDYILLRFVFFFFSFSFFCSTWPLFFFFFFFFWGCDDQRHDVERAALS